VGEGIPRDYVTGETLDSAVKVIRTVYAKRLLAPAPLALAPVEAAGVVHNAAWCACELAYLDALGQSRGTRVPTCWPASSDSSRTGC